ncbi:MAG: DUF6228 family protein [Ketobacteraceae bacterium]|nr:DUF6228 family protein [Ketobacteraceae bacterium]
MDQFRIVGENQMSVTFDSPAYREDGYLSSYKLSIKAHWHSSSIEAENSEYQDDPVNFFTELSEKWKGWEGIIDWQGDNVFLSAKSDNTGHVLLKVNIQTGFHPPNWSSEIVLKLEAGQLDSIARSARSFFS